MKMHRFVLLAAAAVFFLFSCRKDEIRKPYKLPVNPVTPVTSPSSAIPPKSNAGQDIYVEFPADSCELSGSYTQHSYAVDQITWRQLSGISPAVIENPHSLYSKVRNLKIGEYEFELSVKDHQGLEDRDTLKVFVDAIGNNERVFTNVKWGFPWYATLTIPDIHTYIPPGPIKVYVWRNQQPQWREVPPCCTNNADVKYEYFIESRPDGAGMYRYGSLNIFYYGLDTGDSPSVKVVY